MNYIYNDGGREAAGFKGTTGDCTVRAISIITNKPYIEVYNSLNKLIDSNSFRKIRGKHKARTGTPIRVIKKFLDELGYEWIPTMFIGSGCKLHLRKEELPSGNIIVRASRHLVAVKDGVVYDNHDSTRNGNRCVYGYWKLKEASQ